MGLLVVVATMVVVERGSMAPAGTTQALTCPRLNGGDGEVYCELVSVPWPSSGQPCAVGPNVSGLFHGVTFAFNQGLGCGPIIAYEMNGTVWEPGGSAQRFHFDVYAPKFAEWSNYTSPDGLVLVAWFGLSQNVTLAVAT